MTFYWWSHWFWITLISNVILLHPMAFAYPSQEIKLEYNQDDKPPNAVTKLYQTSTTLAWPTAAPTSTQIMDLTQLRSLKSDEEAAETETEVEAEAEIGDEVEVESGEEEIPSKDAYDEGEIDDLDSERLEFPNERNEIPGNEYEKLKIPPNQEGNIYMDENSGEYEYKRSAENANNKTGKADKIVSQIDKEEPRARSENHESAIKMNKKPTVTLTEEETSEPDEIPKEDQPISNDRNSSSLNFSNLSTNTSSPSNVSGTLNLDINSTKANSSLPSAPSVPQIKTGTGSVAAAAEWLTPSSSQQNNEDISRNYVTTLGVAAAQKIPFTLENVNKEDELRRAESEHRSRKSKVLSAEYKQINRYINYSSDPRSLLTRSASTAPNDFESDSESNISSEALAVQRTYFLDAGAISAICFTVFGVCCTIGTIGVVLYRRRYWNKPQTLSEPDSSVYIDDSTMRVSDNSDEMYSLDNDSFLNSLEAMTIQNYWTDTVKHTKL